MKLLDPIRVGDLLLPNRVIMAPMTRARATEDRTPTELMRKYYVQRASAGLIVSEATCISPSSVGYLGTPGLWSNEQVEAWARITAGIHDAGGRIFAQLWHVGRVSHPALLGGERPVAPSPIAPEGHVNLLRPIRDYETPRALRIEEIPGIVEDFRVAASNAQRAGFDGVELHGANGYLPDQFLQSATNKRTDEYGGSLENRARFMFDVIDALISVWGSSRVGLHLSPRADIHSMGDRDLLGTFSYVVRLARQRNLAFLMVREHQAQDSIGPALKKEFGGIYIANEGFSSEAGEQALIDGLADAVAFGEKFISNPDLPARLRAGAPLAKTDAATMYVGGINGFTDYPPLLQTA